MTFAPQWFVVGVLSPRAVLSSRFRLTKVERMQEVERGLEKIALDLYPFRYSDARLYSLQHDLRGIVRGITLSHQSSLVGCEISGLTLFALEDAGPMPWMTYHFPKRQAAA